MAKVKRKYAIERDFEEFGSYLQKMRETADLTQRQVAEELNYSSAQFISNFERGISLPPLNKLKLLMKLYGMPKSHVVNLIAEARVRVMNRLL